MALVLCLHSLLYFFYLHRDFLQTLIRDVLFNVRSPDQRVWHSPCTLFWPPLSPQLLAQILAQERIQGFKEKVHKALLWQRENCILVMKINGLFSEAGAADRQHVLVRWRRTTSQGNLTTLWVGMGLDAACTEWYQLSSELLSSCSKGLSGQMPLKGRGCSGTQPSGFFSSEREPNTTPKGT